MKALRGDISSNFPLWVGIPDFVFGASALLVAVFYARGRIEHRLTFLTVWSLLGAAIILVPTFGLMPYWMQAYSLRRTTRSMRPSKSKCGG